MPLSRAEWVKYFHKKLKFYLPFDTAYEELKREVEADGIKR